MAEITPEEINNLRQQFQQLNDELRSLGGRALEQMPDDIEGISRAIRILSSDIYDIRNAFGSISSILKNTLSDFNSAGKLINSINASYNKLSSITAKVQQHVDGTNILTVKELSDLQKKAEIEVESLRTKQDNIKEALQQNDLTAKQRKLLEDQQKEIKEGFEVQVNYLNQINEEFDKIIDNEKRINNNLGLTGNAFKLISKELQKFGISSVILDNINSELRKTANDGKVGLGDLFRIAKAGFKEAMEDPVARFAVGLGLAKKGFSELTGYIKMAFEAFKSFDTAIVGTARNLGLSRDQVKNFTIEAVQSQSVFNDGLNQNVYSSEQIAKSLTDVNSQLGLSVTLSQGTVNEFTKMTQTMGLSVEEATQIYRFGVLNNKTLKDTNKSISAGIIAAQKSTGVQINAKQVFQEIGKLSAGITSKFQQNPEALAKAVAQAKALGTNLEAVDKVGESLLDFQSSIENELKAELVTGKQINLEKARYAALTGDQVTLTKEIADQVGSLADFEKMNVIGQRSLAQAFGMSREELAEMLTQQETFNKLGDISGKSAAEQLQIARERGLSESDSLVVNLQQQSAAEKLDATFNNLKTTLANLLDGPFKGLVDAMGYLSKHTGLVYGTMTLIAGISLGKMLLGLASMFVSLTGSAIAASTLATALSFGVMALAIAAGIATVYGAMKSANSDAKSQSVGDGVATSGGPFQITNKYGETAITAAGDKLAVSPNITQNKSGDRLDTSPRINNNQSIDLSPMIAAINQVTAAVTDLKNKSWDVHLDSKSVGTGLIQKSYRSA
jgi:hypothetical protein